MGSRHFCGPVTRFQACPRTCGAAAALLVSPAFAAKHGRSAPVEIAAQAMTTDYAKTFAGRSMMSVVGYDMSKEAARQVYEAAGVGPEDIEVVELHDCFRSEEHTSELQSLMRISYAVFCLKKKKTDINNTHETATDT